MLQEKKSRLPAEQMPFDQCDQIWQNLYQFGSILKFLGKILRVYLVFGKMLILLRLNCLTIGQVFIVADGQIF